MKEILLTSSALILALLVLRRLFRRAIPRRMQYALWLLVLARLLIPANVGTLTHNVLSAAAPVWTAVEERLRNSAIYLPTAHEPLTQHPNAPDLAPEQALPRGESSAWLIEDDETAVQYHRIDTSDILTYVWYAGMGGVGAWFLFTNFRFARALRKARTPYSINGCRRPVYLVPELPSPCLFGVLRPAIYLNDAALASPETLRFVLAHEQTHARHLDPLWSLLRGVCLTVYWFDPLVWLAAALSREDCELACDEGTLRTLGTDERTAYGRALLSLIPVCGRPQNPLLGATTMTGGKKSLKDRITRIAENRQTGAAAVFAAVALAALVCTVSFTGAPKVPPEWYDAGFSTGDAQACLEFLDWAEGFNEYAASWSFQSSGDFSGFNALADSSVDRAAEFARVVRSIRAEELSPPTDPAAEMLYSFDVNDGRGSYGFMRNRSGQICLIASAKPVAAVDNAELSDFLRKRFYPSLPDDLTEAQRAVIDDFLHWAQELRAEDILDMQFRGGDGPRLFTDAELSALAEYLVPLLNGLTEADLYILDGYGDSAYYTFSVDMRDGSWYSLFCGLDRVRLFSPAFEPALSSSFPSDRPSLWIDSPALVEFINSLALPPETLPDHEATEPQPLTDILPSREP